MNVAPTLTPVTSSPAHSYSIEVTPEMIKAGADALLDFSRDDDPEITARAVYCAMVAARREAKRFTPPSAADHARARDWHDRIVKG